MTDDPPRTVDVDISVPSTAFELGEVLRPPPGVTIDLVRFVPTGEGPVPYLWVDADTKPFKRFERRVRADERVRDVRSVTAREGRRMVRVAWERSPDGFLDACLADEVMLREASGTHDAWTFELRFLDHDALTAFQQRCVEEGVPITVRRIVTPGDGGEANPYGLTEAQREALWLAFEEGYYLDPRRVTLEELGEALGITRQAVSYRLRAGTHRLIAATLGELHGD